MSTLTLSTAPSMSNSLHVAWIKPAILSLLQPLLPTPPAPPLQVSDYTSASSSPSSSSSSSSARVVFILSDSRHRIAAVVSPSALSAHLVPLPAFRGAIIRPTDCTLQYTLSASADSLAAGDEFVLALDGFELLGASGIAEVGQPVACMEDEEVRETLSTIKAVDLQQRRARLSSTSSSSSSAPAPSLSASALCFSPFPPLAADLAAAVLPASSSAALSLLHLSPQSQRVLDTLPPFPPSQLPPLAGAEFPSAPSQWSSEEEREEKDAVVFSQFVPFGQRGDQQHAQQQAASSSFSVSPLPRIALPVTEPAFPSSPQSPSRAAFASQQQPESPSAAADDFYSTQAPLSLLSPPLSPASSLSSSGSQAGGPLLEANQPLSTYDVDCMREEEDSKLQQQQQHSTGDALAAGQGMEIVEVEDEEEEDTGMRAGGEGGANLEEKYSLSEQEAEAETTTAAAAAGGDDEYYSTQAPMLSELQESQEPQSFFLSQAQELQAGAASPPSSSSPPPLQLPSLPLAFPSSMPPLSPGTPSPRLKQEPETAASQRSKAAAAVAASAVRVQLAFDAAIRAATVVRPTPPEREERKLPLPVSIAAAQSRQRAEEEVDVLMLDGADDFDADDEEVQPSTEGKQADHYSAEHIRQRQQRRNQQLLSQRQRNANGDQQQQEAAAESDWVLGKRQRRPSGNAAAEAVEDDEGRRSRGSRGRTVRFSDQQRAEEKDPERVDDSEQEEGKEERRRSGTAAAAAAQAMESVSWSDDDHDFFIGYWRCVSLSPSAPVPASALSSTSPPPLQRVDARAVSPIFSPVF